MLLLELCALDKIIGSTTVNFIVWERPLGHGDLVIESSSQNYCSLGSASVALDLFPRTLEKCSEKANGSLTCSQSLSSNKLQKCLKCTWELSVLLKPDLVLSRQRFGRAEPSSEGPWENTQKKSTAGQLFIRFHQKVFNTPIVPGPNFKLKKTRRHVYNGLRVRLILFGDLSTMKQQSSSIQHSASSPPYGGEISKF